MSAPAINRTAQLPPIPQPKNSASQNASPIAASEPSATQKSHLKSQQILGFDQTYLPKQYKLNPKALHYLVPLDEEAQNPEPNRVSSEKALKVLGLKQTKQPDQPAADRPEKVGGFKIPSKFVRPWLQVMPCNLYSKSHTKTGI